MAAPFPFGPSLSVVHWRLREEALSAGSREKDIGSRGESQ